MAETHLPRTYSDCTTAGIRVEAYPSYIAPGRESHEHEQNYFSYRIRITNTRQDRVQLLHREWLIINADGQEHRVDGPGVVGNMPELLSEEVYEYTSYCPMDTSWGTMEGYYTFVTANAEKLRVRIERFYLVIPELIDVE
jgi:ApaG protein